VTAIAAIVKMALKDIALLRWWRQWQWQLLEEHWNVALKIKAIYTFGHVDHFTL
jgi:hypothetical protein